MCVRLWFYIQFRVHGEVFLQVASGCLLQDCKPLAILLIKALCRAQLWDWSICSAPTAHRSSSTCGSFTAGSSPAPCAVWRSFRCPAECSCPGASRLQGCVRSPCSTGGCLTRALGQEARSHRCTRVLTHTLRRLLKPHRNPSFSGGKLHTT